MPKGVFIEKYFTPFFKNFNMKNYKVVLGGRGAEVYIHPINEEQKQKLKEMDVENENVSVDWDKLNSVLGVESWDYSDEIYSGPYDNPSAYHITVVDEEDKIIFSSDENFYMEEGENEEDIKFIQKDDVLIIEHYLKGSFKEYTLNIEENFDENKLTPVIYEINEIVSVITDLKYENNEMDLEEYGDNWSKGAFFHIS